MRSRGRWFSGRPRLPPVRWLARNPVQYELPAGVATDLPALQEAGDAPWVERVAVRLSNVIDGATADDVPPVVA